MVKVWITIDGRCTKNAKPQSNPQRQEHPSVVAFECTAIPYFEYSAIMMLTEFEQALSDSGLTLWLVALNPRRCM